MSIGALDAVSAYSRTLSAMPPMMPADAEESLAPGTGAMPAGDASSSFGGMIQNMVGETAGSLRKAETESAKQVAGKGDLIDVVTAVGAAETALNTMVAVRDRVVSAYSEIMRMQI